MKKILFILMILTLLVSTSAFAASELSIKDFDVRVNGHSENNADEDGGKIEVNPGDEVVIKVTLENTFSSSEDIEIQDIEVNLYIEDLGTKDIDIDEDFPDLDANKNDDLTLTFQVPYLLEKGNYDMVFTADGEDDNDTRHSVEQTFTLRVEKEDDELTLVNFKPIIEPVVCGDILQLAYHIVNTGDDNQKDTKIKVLIDDLSYVNTVMYDFMTDFDDDEEMEYENILDIDLSELQKTTFSARIEVTNDDDIQLITDLVEITYSPCVVKEEVEVKEEVKEVIPKVEEKQEIIPAETNSNSDAPQKETTASSTGISYSKITKQTQTNLFSVGNILLLTLILLVIILIVLATKITAKNKND